MVGWFKQTVDKPNASLSADRRGTLSMPDLESFIVSSKNQEEPVAHIKRKNRKKGDEEHDAEGDEEDAETLSIQLAKGQGTRTRPGLNFGM